MALPQVWLPTEIFVLHGEVNLWFPLPAIRRHNVMTFQWLAITMEYNLPSDLHVLLARNSLYTFLSM